MDTLLITVAVVVASATALVLALLKRRQAMRDEVEADMERVLTPDEQAEAERYFADIRRQLRQRDVSADDEA